MIGKFTKIEYIYKIINLKNMSYSFKKVFISLILLSLSFILKAQSSRFVNFITGSETITVAYYLEAPLDRPDSYADLYVIDQDGVVKLLQAAEKKIDGKRVVISYNGLTYKNARYGNEYRLFLPLTAEARALTLSDARKEAIALETAYPDRPIAIRGLSKLGSPVGLAPAQAAVNRLQIAFDTAVTDCDNPCSAAMPFQPGSVQTKPLVSYTVKDGQSVEDVVVAVRTAAKLNQSELFPSVRQRRDRRLYEWNQRHAMILAHNEATKPNVILIGDSITHYWGDQAGCYLDFGRQWFDEIFEGWRTTDLGYGWDRIENMMWRLDHGEMDGYSAKHIFIMAGTNNIWAKMSDQRCEEVARGVVELVKYIRVKQPKARIHLVRIYPRRGNENRINMVNDLAVKGVEGMDNLDIIDCAPVLADSEGNTIVSLFSDGTHPNDAGYKLIAETYRNYLK